MTSSSTISSQKLDRGGSNWLIYVGLLWLILAAALLIYQMTNPASVRVEWETATELNTAGFQLYRSNVPFGDFELITKELIPSEGDSVSGATYTFVDENVEAGATYFYVLEEVEFDSSTNRYDEDMFSYTVPRVAWWVIILSGISAIAGLALLATGLKERKG